jgi:predicted amidohydrolase
MGYRSWLIAFPVIALTLFSAAATGSEIPSGWRADSYRAETKPAFSVEAKDGKTAGPAMVIAADSRPGLDGFWVREFPVVGGRWYRFRVWRRAENMAEPRRNANAEVFWIGSRGRPVPTDEEVAMQPDFLADGETGRDGWTEVSGVYRAPSRATKAEMHLHLRWASNARVFWSDASITEIATPPTRKVRLAAAHFKPRGGKSPADNCRMYAPMIEEAARRNADLIVLGEALTAVDNGHTFAAAAEPIPGPSTNYFGELARKHNIYVVAGLVERERHVIYNTAVLLGPDGVLMGKYRKVTIPTLEVQAGVAPGEEYPVFQTRFGKLGIMICYDVWFPEVARQLANRGAEVIAMPIYGGNHSLAVARAIENQIHLVSSTYMPPSEELIRSGVIDQLGRQMAAADREGTVAIAEVDLEKNAAWSWLGYFRARVPRDRPVWNAPANR